MKIADIVPRSDAWVDAYASIEEARQQMNALHMSCIPVRDGQAGEFIGIVTAQDLASCAGTSDIEITPVRAVMTKLPLCCFDDEEVSVAASLMSRNATGRLLVIDRFKQVVGIVSRVDVELIWVTR